MVLSWHVDRSAGLNVAAVDVHEPGPVQDPDERLLETDRRHGFLGTRRLRVRADTEQKFRRQDRRRNNSIRNATGQGRHKLVFSRYRRRYSNGFSR